MEINLESYDIIVDNLDQKSLKLTSRNKVLYLNGLGR